MNAATLLHILQKPSALENVSLETLEKLAENYPWMGAAHLLIALKKKTEGQNDAASLQKAALYFSNPLWLHYQYQQWETALRLHEETTAETEATPTVNTEATPDGDDKDSSASTPPEPAAEAVAEATGITSKEGLDTTEKETMLFEPLFAVDYFASQGIKLKEEVAANDKLSQQVKSFTQWLKSMKKIHAPEEAVIDASREKEVIAQAADANLPSEVITEAMAEVLVKQHKIQQAIDMYRKLSLLHPEKSHYFASRIEILNTSK